MAPILLDSVSIKHDVVHLLDTFFHILIFHSKLVAQWQNQGYQDKEGYENFKELLEVPVSDAQGLLVGQFPARDTLFVIRAKVRPDSCCPS